MGKLISASINLKKVDTSLLIEGKKGRYLNLTIWLNDEQDQFGNDVSVEQRTEKGKPKIYLGNGRAYKPSEAPVGHQPIDEKDELDDMFK